MVGSSGYISTDFRPRVADQVASKLKAPKSNFFIKVAKMKKMLVTETLKIGIIDW